MSSRRLSCVLLLIATLLGCDSEATDSDGGSSEGGAGSGAAGSGGDGAQSTVTGGAAEGGGAAGGAPGSIILPPANAQLDYQLGGAYTPPDGVQVLSRDRNATPEPGLYNICYVNGYQAQAEDAQWWTSEHPDLVLRDDSGNPIIDPDWDEMLLDISTPEKRAALSGIVGDWIERCNSDGFDATEIDNLDTYSRSQGLLSEDDAVAFMQLLSGTAHDSGLAIAQKNSTELLARRQEMGTDFAVAEECNRYAECGDYQDAYGDLVFVIEYRQEDFDVGCAEHDGLSIVLRDLNLQAPDSSLYVYEAC